MTLEEKIEAMSDEDRASFDALVSEGYSPEYLLAPKDGQHTDEWKAAYVRTTADWMHYYRWAG